MSVTHNGKKPGTLWHLRTRTGAFIAACKDKSTRHIARVMRRDAALSAASFVTTGVFLKVSATAITGFIFSYGLPVAAGAGLLMGAKSYRAYQKAARSGKKSTHVRDGLLAVGAIGAGVFLLSSGAAAVVSMVVGVGAPVAAVAGVAMGYKSWRGARKLGASTPAYRYTREAEAAWVEKKERAPLLKRITRGLVNIATSPLRLFKGKAATSSNDNSAPETTQQGSAPALTNTAREEFAQAQDPQRAEAARQRAEARAQRKRGSDGKTFHY